MKVKLRTWHKALIIILFILILGMLLPGATGIPVKNATRNDWNPDSFWYEPWGDSGVHKGIDIFSTQSTEVISPGHGLVLYTGEVTLGGNIVILLTAKWRIHYFAHLDEIGTHGGAYLAPTEQLGTVGDSGNAKGKQPHLHYSIVSLIPYVWKMDGASQGWKKMFILNPIDYMT